MRSDQSKKRIRRLSVWFLINLVIFVACYLNYRLQLKHRYLYRTLSVGLCLSRAAAMLINFNLVLVWLPMCKYTLTRIAVLASNANASLRSKLDRLLEATPIGSLEASSPSPSLCHNKGQGDGPESCRLAGKFSQALKRFHWKLSCRLCRLRIAIINSFLVAVDHATSLHTISATTITLASVIHTVAHLMNVINFSKNYDPLLESLNMAEYRGQNPLQLLVSVPGITGCFMIIILFLMSLSSISPIRNSSFDLFQVFHRLSVLFVILLIFHPSSQVLKEQVNVDRHHPEVCYNKMVHYLGGAILATRANESLLFAGSEPRPEFARRLQAMQHLRTREKQDTEALGLHDQRSRYGPSASSPPGAPRETTKEESSLLTRDLNRRRARRRIRKLESRGADIVNTTNATTHTPLDSSPYRDGTGLGLLNLNQTTASPDQRTTTAATITTTSSATTSLQELLVDEQCPDLLPRFVPQSSICWYVLGAGLSCYILDLILRRLRRSRSPIELLDARSDSEGNLIELVLSNNHKRFAYWLPGQFVYLNCPQIATYEWHPFTISSMDNRTRQFTLHIKAGGDWTRKLRKELEQRQSPAGKQLGPEQGHGHWSLQGYDEHQPRWPRAALLAAEGRLREEPRSMSLFSQVQKCNSSLEGGSKIGFGQQAMAAAVTATRFRSPAGSGRFSRVNVVARPECCDQRTGQREQPKVQCRKLVRLDPSDDDDGQRRDNGSEQQTGKRERQLSAAKCDPMESSRDWPPGIDLDGERGGGNSCCPICSISPAGQQMQVSSRSSLANAHANLDLFIDGPFHSPFERLLEQQVSVCIANGIGWTAFSSVFQQILNDISRRGAPSKDVWWAQWRDYARPTRSGTTRKEISLEGAGQGALVAPPGAETVNSPDDETRKQRTYSSLDTKLHLMIIVATIEQLRPFYNIVMRYFDYLNQERAGGAQIANPVRDVTAFITRSTKRQAEVIEFCHREGLVNSSTTATDCEPNPGEDTLIVNDTFLIRFGKPNLDEYLHNFSNVYRDKRKISIYCCGSYQVKRTVEEICRNLNRSSRWDSSTGGGGGGGGGGPGPTYCYHEENF